MFLSDKLLLWLWHYKTVQTENTGQMKILPPWNSENVSKSMHCIVKVFCNIITKQNKQTKKLITWAKVYYYLYHIFVKHRNIGCSNLKFMLAINRCKHLLSVSPVKLPAIKDSHHTSVVGCWNFNGITYLAFNQKGVEWDYLQGWGYLHLKHQQHQVNCFDN